MTLETTLPAKKYCDVDGHRIAYVDEGFGSPVVLVHGNPTSSYLWRNVIPSLVGNARVIVPDLIGHGDSDKLQGPDGPERYSFEIAYHYLERMLDKLFPSDKITLVLHDWGTALGFHWARLHPFQVRGIAYMEGIVMPIPSWDDWPEKARGIFQGFRSSKGEDMILNRNLFIEAVLPNSILRKLSDEEMNHYRAPFQTTSDRQTILNWPRQIPIDGEPVQMVTLVQQYADWLSSTSMPKLFINAEPGSILVGRQRDFCRGWPNQTEVTVKGLHFLQEDSGQEIGTSIANWMSSPDFNDIR
jgi:haloalkane dehalogenase